MPVGRHQTLSAIIKIMQIDEALKFVYANAHVKHGRLAYGEIVDASPDLFDMDCSPFVLAQAVLCVAGFPARMTFALDCLGPPPEDQVYHLVEKLMSDGKHWTRCHKIQSDNGVTRSEILSTGGERGGVRRSGNLQTGICVTRDSFISGWERILGVDKYIEQFEVSMAHILRVRANEVVQKLITLHRSDLNDGSSHRNHSPSHHSST
jgi:hypothetical protein